MERPTCKTCPYWADYHDGESLAFGRCHKALPQAPLYKEQGDLPPYTHEQANWLITFPTDFCGAHPDFPAYLKVRAESVM